MKLLFQSWLILIVDEFKEKKFVKCTRALLLLQTLKIVILIIEKVCVSSKRKTFDLQRIYTYVSIAR